MTAVWFALTLALHPFHTSVAEVDLNRDRRSLEVALRVDANELEQALGDRLQAAFQLEDERTGELTAALLRDHLFVRAPGAKDPAPLAWVGMELDRAYAWLYFELTGIDEIQGCVIRHTLFFDLQPEQVNTVTLREGLRRTTLHFTLQRPEQEVDLPARGERLQRAMRGSARGVDVAQAAKQLAQFQAQLACTAAVLRQSVPPGTMARVCQSAPSPEVAAAVGQLIERDPGGIPALLRCAALQGIAEVRTYTGALLAAEAWCAEARGDWPAAAVLRRAGQGL